jgi:DNA-directed RNA polymerase specialized sigma24 family protein
MDPIQQRQADSDPARSLEAEELRNVVEREIDALSARRREVFIFAHLHDLTYRQIAEIMGISVQTVANHMSTALADLRKGLAPYLRDARQSDRSSLQARGQHEPALRAGYTHSSQV